MTRSLCGVALVVVGLLAPLLYFGGRIEDDLAAGGPPRVLRDPALMVGKAFAAFTGCRLMEAVQVGR